MSTTTESDVNDGPARKPVRGNKNGQEHVDGDDAGDDVMTPMDSGTPGPRGPETVRVPKKN